MIVFSDVFVLLFSISIQNFFYKFLEIFRKFVNEDNLSKMFFLLMTVFIN